MEWEGGKREAGSSDGVLGRRCERRMSAVACLVARYLYPWCRHAGLPASSDIVRGRTQGRMRRYFVRQSFRVCNAETTNLYVKPATPRPRDVLPALGEALSHAFRLTLVQTVPRRFLTLSYALSRPSERQRRSTRSPRRPDRFSCRHSGDPGVGKGAQDGQEKRPELRGELHLAAFPRLQRPAQAAVSCTAIKTR